ncbi:MAG: DUF948 domain-containing protein [Crocosphaera sp.]|nr:DUF948 domain-containing protein [Crocosphaera sp.]
MVNDPLFWLGCSLFLVALSLTTVLIVLIPVLQELAKAARSADKLFNTLERDFPATLESIRLTGVEITELTEDINDGVKSASEVVKQMDKTIHSTQGQMGKLKQGTLRLTKGIRVAWQTWHRSPQKSLEKEQK